MKKIMAFLIPQGEIVRDPFNKMTPLVATGEERPLFGKEGRYWRRRINEGSVKIQEPKIKTKIAKHKSNKED